MTFTSAKKQFAAVARNDDKTHSTKASMLKAAALAITGIAAAPSEALWARSASPAALTTWTQQLKMTLVGVWHCKTVTENAVPLVTAGASSLST